jgi:hypothetical protein
MSWILRSRGDSTAPILVDYECPADGRFEATVRRPAPDTAPCPICSRPSSWCPPAPRCRAKPGEVVQGKVMDYPPANVCLDTRALADDPSPSGYAKWRDKQRTITRDEGLTRARRGRR